jgi:hypothetical protein
MFIWNTEFAFSTFALASTAPTRPSTTSTASIPTTTIDLTPPTSTTSSSEFQPEESTSTEFRAPTTTSTSPSTNIPLVTNASDPNPPTDVIIGGAVGASLGLLFVLIGAGWLFHAFRKKKKAQQQQPHPGPKSMTGQSEYGVFGPPQQHIYDDVDEVRQT